MNETIHTEEAYGRAMAQVARAENDRLARVMSGEPVPAFVHRQDALPRGHVCRGRSQGAAVPQGGCDLL